MSDLQTLLFSLSSAVGIGAQTEVADLAARALAPYAQVERGTGLTVVGRMAGEAPYTILLDAHLDEVGMIVTDVDDAGFLRVAAAGGLDLRTLPARQVTVWGKKPVPAVFCSTPPHLAKGEQTFDDIGALAVDTGLGDNAKTLISPGDFVTFRQKPAALTGGRVTGKAFDDRAAVACLIETARRLHESGRPLPCEVVFLLSDQEELGLRGARTAAFRLEPDEAVAVDVSFGDGPDVPAHACGKLGGGAMLGISPTLSPAVTDGLRRVAERDNIPWQPEAMGGATSTNADAIALSRAGVPCSLLSIPLRNMHTPVEVVDLADLESVCRLLTAYLLTGGCAHA